MGYYLLYTLSTRGNFINYTLQKTQINQVYVILNTKQTYYLDLS